MLLGVSLPMVLYGEFWVGLTMHDYLAFWYGLRVFVDIEGFIFGVVTPLVASLMLIVSGAILRTANIMSKIWALTPLAPIALFFMSSPFFPRFRSMKTDGGMLLMDLSPVSLLTLFVVLEIVTIFVAWRQYNRNNSGAASAPGSR